MSNDTVTSRAKVFGGNIVQQVLDDALVAEHLYLSIAKKEAELAVQAERERILGILQSDEGIHFALTAEHLQKLCQIVKGSADSF